MYENCTRCGERKDIGSLVKITKGWGGRRTGETVCFACKRPDETYDSASD